MKVCYVEDNALIKDSRCQTTELFQRLPKKIFSNTHLNLHIRAIEFYQLLH